MTSYKLDIFPKIKKCYRVGEELLRKVTAKILRLQSIRGLMCEGTFNDDIIQPFLKKDCTLMRKQAGLMESIQY